jgi:hypothetical protein
MNAPCDANSTSHAGTAGHGPSTAGAVYPVGEPFIKEPSASSSTSVLMPERRAAL